MESSMLDSINFDAITNYSARDTRRVDIVFGIGYGDNIPFPQMDVHIDQSAAESSVL
jgi:small-conductance mechanosensitive channel